jgi:branched-subunit amino acid aminotransferase/4-amino-4-deoxychorismate lyase
MTNPSQNFGFWYDGQWQAGEQISLKVNDPGLLYGATVFSTMRVYEKQLNHPLTLWAAHCDRLSQSIQALGWRSPDWAKLRQGAERMAQDYPILRLTLFPDGREWITGRMLPLDLVQRQQQGIVARVAPELGQRSLPHLKTGNYLTPWLGLQQQSAYSVQEMILVDQEGNWLETTIGNLWGWGDGVWYTPSLANGLLPGIQREQILAQLRARGQVVVEHVWSIDWVQKLQWLGYSNCVVQMMPIRSVWVGNDCWDLGGDRSVVEDLWDWMGWGTFEA